MYIIRLLSSYFLFFILVSGLFAQSREGMIQLELKNYETKVLLGQIEGKGETIEGIPHGYWEYFLVYDHNIKYYSGHYEHGKKCGVWDNYALQPPMGYNDNYDLKRSSEAWQDGKLYRFKMGQDNLLVTIDDGLPENQTVELKRLDEAFENSYRRTHGKTFTAEFGESVESIQARLIPMIRQELLSKGQRAELKFWSLYNKLRLHEIYDSGMVISSFVQQWDKMVLFSKEKYEYGILREKTIFLEGNPSNFIQYQYHPDGDMLYMHQYVNDTVPAGRWVENCPNGEKKSLGSYVDGKRHGKWKFWDKNGNTNVVKYKEGIEQ